MRRIIIVCSMVLAVIGTAYGQAANASVDLCRKSVCCI